MADNTDEENLDSPTNTQSENPSDDIIPTQDTENINLNQEIKNMEVHPQELHKAPGHGWKHYLFEFLMLFLAVFCGFLAENQREHMVERDREKIFIQTFIEDLKVDTADINRVLIFRQQKQERMDSLMLLLSSGQIKGHERDLYFFGRTLIRTANFNTNDRTITQLKNSGSLRLIRNEQAADSMMSYQISAETIIGNQADDRIERRSADPILSRMFNPFVFDKMVNIDGINRLTDNLPLRSYDPAIQQDLAYYVHQIKGSNFIIFSRLGLLKEKAKNIMIFLQKEYHLE